MKVFTTGQVAKICKVAPRTVSKWFDSGRLKGYRIPGSQDRRIPREYLIKFLKEHGMPLGDLEDEAMAKVLIVAQVQCLGRERIAGQSFVFFKHFEPTQIGFGYFRIGFQAVQMKNGIGTVPHHDGFAPSDGGKVARVHVFKKRGRFLTKVKAQQSVAGRHPQT